MTNHTAHSRLAAGPDSASDGPVSGLDASSRLAAGLAATLLGAFFVFGVGFAHSAALHDTAHDIRHSYGFPCH